MEDGNFWHLGGVTRWNSQFLKYTRTFLAIICVASQLFLCFFWIHLWVKNRCLQHPCFKNLRKIAQASKNSDSNAQHFLFGFANTFMMFTPCSLHSQVINSLILSWIGVSTLLFHEEAHERCMHGITHTPLSITKTAILNLNSQPLHTIFYDLHRSAAIFFGCMSSLRRRALSTQFESIVLPAGIISSILSPLQVCWNWLLILALHLFITQGVSVPPRSRSLTKVS
jgi:hypothetical protein